MNIDKILDDIIGVEGGYCNHPDDKGGPTRWGITQATARQHGWKGDMRSFPRDQALDIYRRRYVIAPGFDAVGRVSPAIAAELVDTGVNMGPATASRFLQRALNALNNQGRDYGDIAADGAVGAATVGALNAFLKKRGKEGEKVMLAALNALQGARYIELCEGRAANESFAYGWLARRVAK